jgi:hypothetical protein
MKPIVALAAALSVSLVALAAQTRDRSAAASARAPALTTMDYIEIQQLARRFVWALDGGDNFGYAYADLFTPDGVFTDMRDGPNGKTTQGRDNLALIARGGQRGPLNLNHFGMNHVITPSAAPGERSAPDATAAKGKAYVVMLDLAKRPHSVTDGGHYEDVYEKTGLGWRFKSRTFHRSKVDFWPPAATPSR